MNQQAVESPPKKMGRPKGSKNRKNLFAGKDVAEVCHHYNFNPTIMLITIANGTNRDEDWSKDDRFRAATKLLDVIHGKSKLEGAEDAEQGQYEIVFVEADAGFELPRETGTAGTT